MADGRAGSEADAAQARREGANHDQGNPDQLRLLHGLPLLRGGLQEGLGLPEGEFGIKLTETGPWEYAAEPAGPGRWEWTWLPVLTKACDLCEGRTSKGKMPMCVQHCQAWCMYYGEVGELAAKMDGRTRWALMVPSA